MVKVGALLSVVRITSGGTKYHGAQRPMTHHLRQIVSGHSVDLSDWTGELLQIPPVLGHLASILFKMNRTIVNQRLCRVSRAGRAVRTMSVDGTRPFAQDERARRLAAIQ